MGASRAQRAAAAKKRNLAIALRLAGMEWAQVATRAGYRSAGAACTAVTEAMREALREQGMKAEELRQLNAMRYERLLAAAWPKALTGDTKAVEGAARIVDRLVRLHGLAPEKLDVDVTGEITADALIALIQGGQRREGQGAHG